MLIIIVILLGIVLIIYTLKTKCDSTKPFKKKVLILLPIVSTLGIALGSILMISQNMMPDNVKIHTGTYELLERNGEYMQIVDGKATCYVDKERHVIYEDGVLTFEKKDIKIVQGEEKYPKLILQETIYSYDLWKTILFAEKETVVESKAIIQLPATEI